MNVKRKVTIMTVRKRISTAITAAITLLLIMLFTINVNAVGETGRERNYKIANGVWESTVYVTDSKGDNVRAHILRISKGTGVTLKATTANYYKSGSTKTSRKKSIGNWGFTTVTNMMSAYDASKEKEGKTIAGINGDFYIKEENGKTRGKLISEGNVINPTTDEPFFAVMKDGTYKMMEGGENTSGVSEAVAGLMWLVRDGKITGSAAGNGDTTVSIGVTASGDVVIACIDGREPTSAGTTMFDTGEVMLKQGCTDAILLDCGGSAQFVTKRNGGKAVQRNVPNDGVARTISSGILVVKKSNAAPSKDIGAAVSMKNGKTKLSKKNGYYYYKANGKKISGFRIINDRQYLFSKSGKGITKTIKIGKTKYYYKKGKLSRTSDAKAGRIAIGYCGASKDKQNLLYAYNYGDKKLSIGLNPLVKNNSGKMEDWIDVRYVPWLSVIRFVRTIDVGDGVKNLGDYFMRVSKTPFNEAAKKLISPLRSVSLPNSLTTIGNRAFFYNPKLTKMVIPKNVKTIKESAFAYNGKVTYIFKSKNPPKFGKSVFIGGKKSVMRVPSTKKWKAFKKSKKLLKKLGFKGSIK